MSVTTRVAITGIGVISALGRGKETQLDAVRSARSGVRFLKNVATAENFNPIGGEIDDEWIGREFPEHDRFARLALIAASEAVEQSNLSASGITAHRLGAVIGTGLGGSATIETTYARLFAEKQTRFAPMTIPKSMYNAATSAVATRFDAQGPGFSTVSACASGTHAIGQAALWIRAGLCDAVLAGGADAPLLHGIIRGWEGLRVLAPADGDPASACRPFSADRKGIVLAEGAAVFVLEKMDSAIARGATIVGEIAGFGMSMDAGHITDPTVAGPLRAMRGALDDAGASIEDVDYVNAHGTATRANDVVETAALRELLGSRADAVPVSSTKSMHGHAMGAGGAIELAVSLVALNEGVIPATLHWRERDPKCDLDYVPNEPRSGEVGLFLNNSFGFGGMNAVLAVRRDR